MLALTNRLPWHGIAVLLLFLGYFFLTAYRIHSPAMAYDDLVEARTGAGLAEIFLREGRLNSWSYPLYHGHLVGHLMFPLFSFFGTSHALVKLWSVGMGALTLAAAYLLVRRMFHRQAALLTLFLLVIHPSILGGFRLGSSRVFCMIFFSTASLYFLQRWQLRGSLTFLAAGMFLASLGLGTRLWYAYYVVALIGTALVSWKSWSKGWRHLTPGHRRLTIWVGLLAFGAGALPIVRHELAAGFPSFQNILFPQGIDQLAPRDPLLQSLGNTWEGLSLLLSGRWYFNEQFPGLPAVDNGLYPIFFLAALLSGVFLLARSHVVQASDRGRWLFVTCLVLFMLALTLFNPPGRSPGVRPHYLFILYPFPQIVISLMFVYWRRLVHGVGWRLVPAACLGLLIFGEARVLALYLHYVRLYDGLGLYSSTIRDTADWLKKNSKGGVVAVMDQSIDTSLYFWAPSLPAKPFQTFDKMSAEFFENSADFSFLQAWQEEIRALGYRKSPSHRYPGLSLTLRDPEKHFFAEWEAFLSELGRKDVFLIRYRYEMTNPYTFDLVAYWAVQRQRSLRLQARFHDRDGTPMMEVYRLRPEEPASRLFDTREMAF